MDSLYKTERLEHFEGIRPIAGANSDAKLEVWSEETVVQAQSDEGMGSQIDIGFDKLAGSGEGSTKSPAEAIQHDGLDDKTVVLADQTKHRERRSNHNEATQVSGLNEPAEYSEISHSTINRRVVNENMLVSCAMPLIHQSMSLAAMDEPADIDSVRSRLISDMGRFQNKAEQCISDQRHVAAARYLLCSFIDETIATTPWGVSHRWGGESLLSYFHNETYGGDGFFTLLERAKRQPQQYLDLLELMYVCISLGFAGRYRVDKNGATKLEGIRESMMATITKYQAPDNRSLVIGEINSRAEKKKRAMWFAPVVVAVLILSNVAGYLLFSNQIEARMDTTSDYVLSHIGVSN